MGNVPNVATRLMPVVMAFVLHEMSLGTVDNEEPKKYRHQERASLFVDVLILNQDMVQSQGISDV